MGFELARTQPTGTIRLDQLPRRSIAEASAAGTDPTPAAAQEPSAAPKAGDRNGPRCFGCFAQ